jgi:hypothetical protein
MNKAIQAAKIKRKATKAHRRRLQANTKIVLAAVPAIAQGMMTETEKYLIFERQAELDQIKRIWRWSNKCLDGITLGVKSVEVSCTIIRQVDAEVQKIIRPGTPKTIGHYAVVWLMIGYLADEARSLAPAKDKRSWNYFASVVNTWTGMLLGAAPHDGTDYESEAGELADRAWSVVFGRPRESFGRL